MRLAEVLENLILMECRTKSRQMNGCQRFRFLLGEEEKKCMGQAQEKIIIKGLRQNKLTI